MNSIQLFVLGDSISIHYGPHLARFLPPWIAYARKGQSAGVPPEQLDDGNAAINGGDSACARAYLQERYAGAAFRPDVLLLNCGLHDVKTGRGSGAKQVPPDAYRQNLHAILALARAHGAQVIWVTSTPVDDALHRARESAFLRFDADVQAYNRIAGDVFGSAEYPIIDLYGFTARLGDGLYCDHVHYTDEVRRLQGAHIAGYLAAALAGRRVPLPPENG